MVLWAVGPARLDDVAASGRGASSGRGPPPRTANTSRPTWPPVWPARDVAVVSGGAYGIDGAAHRAALAADGFTVAVLAGGIDVPYPAGHSALLHRIAEDGLVISEYPPGVRPARHRFLTRNRLVAALAGATVVVEAGRAQWGRQHRGVGAGLGSARCARCPARSRRRRRSGCHALLRAGANSSPGPRRSSNWSDDVGELAPETQRPTSPLDGLAEAERRVYDALPARGARTADEIAVASGLPATQVLGPLAMLEVSRAGRPPRRPMEAGARRA